jgi:hypothetical protein
MSEYAVLELVCGRTTLDLLSAPYALAANGYAPAIASRSKGDLGGKGIYNDVPEEIIIDIHGDTPAEVYGGQQNLIAILDRADAWENSGAREAVILRFQPQHSLLDAPLESLVVGKTGDSDALLSLAANYNDRILIYEIEGARIAFRRRGQLLGDEETAESASAVTLPGVVSAAALSETDFASPTAVELLGLGLGTELLGDGFLALTTAPVASVNGTNFGIFAAADMTGDGFASQDDAANNAYGDDIMRIDAASDQSGSLTIDVDSDHEALLVYVALRNNGATTPWRVRAKSTGYLDTTTRWQVVGTASQQPQIVALDVLRSVADYHKKIVIEVETAQSSGTLDVNYIATVPLVEDTHVIAIRGGAYTTQAYTYDLVVDHQALARKRAIAYLRAAQS